MTHLRTGLFKGTGYLVALGLVTAAVAVLAFFFKNSVLALSAAILGLYVLHLLSIRFILQGQEKQRASLAVQWQLLQQLVESTQVAPGGMQSAEGETVHAETGRATALAEGPLSETDVAREAAAAVWRDTPRDVLIPRRLALGTVAIVRGMLEPSEVAQILLKQRQQPDRRFGELAIERGLLTALQLEVLLRVQQKGLFTDTELEVARSRLQEFRG